MKHKPSFWSPEFIIIGALCSCLSAVELSISAQMENKIILFLSFLSGLFGWVASSAICSGMYESGHEDGEHDTREKLRGYILEPKDLKPDEHYPLAWIIEHSPNLFYLETTFEGKLALVGTKLRPPQEATHLAYAPKLQKLVFFKKYPG